MREHIRILGILNIIMGALGVLIGLGILLVMGGVAGVITAALRSANDPDYQNGIVAAPIVATIGVAIAVFFFILSLPAILGGWGLMNFRPWSRILMIIVSVFHLFHVPIGTAVGIYGLWVLLNTESQRILESGGMTGGSIAPAIQGAGTYQNPTTYPPPPSPPRV